MADYRVILKTLLVANIIFAISVILVFCFDIEFRPSLWGLLLALAVVLNHIASGTMGWITFSTKRNAWGILQSALNFLIGLPCFGVMVIMTRAAMVQELPEDQYIYASLTYFGLLAFNAFMSRSQPL